MPRHAPGVAIDPQLGFPRRMSAVPLSADYVSEDLQRRHGDFVWKVASATGGCI